MARIEVKYAAAAAGVAAIVAGALGFAFASLGGIGRGPGLETAVHDYLVENPQVLMEMQDALIAQRDAENQRLRDEALAAAGLAALTDPGVAFVVGPEDAAVTVAEFFDYRCPYCKASLTAVETALADHADVRFAFIEYPILTEDSALAAHAAVAARRQPGKYIPFHIALMKTTGELPRERILAIAVEAGLDLEKLETDMADPAVLATIDAAHALADRLRVSGTPTFVINDKFSVGQLTGDQLERLIEEARS